jgi:hypothetical protein
VDLAEHRVDHGVEEVLLAPDVVVQRHRLDLEPLGQGPHRQGREATLVSGAQGLRDDAVAAERQARGRHPASFDVGGPTHLML